MPNPKKRLYEIQERSDSDGRVFYKAVGFLGGRSYRNLTSATSNYRSATLAVMTRSPHARHPGEWPTPAEQQKAKEAARQSIYNDAMNH